METTVEQTENLAEMAIRKKTVKRTKTRTARPRILRKRTLPKLKKRREALETLSSNEDQHFIETARDMKSINEKLKEIKTKIS